MTSSPGGLEQTAAWQKVVQLLEQLDDVKRREDEIIAAINRLHTDLVSKSLLLNPSTVEKLSKLYKDGISKCADEQKFISSAIKELTALVAIKKSSDPSISLVSGDQSRHELPEHHKKRKRKGEDEKVGSVIIKKPRSMSKPASEPLQAGQAVAALTHGENGQLWILARILSYNPEKGKYQVQDDEPDEAGVKARYLLHHRHVLALPPASLPTSWQEVEVGGDVLALYPSTSCFYRGTVILPPSKNRQKLPAYVVTFEEDAGQELPVHAHMVIPFPKDVN